MRKVVTSLIAVVLSVAMLFSLTGCKYFNRDIRKLITEFEHACNTHDFAAVLDCINPKIADNIKIAAGFVEKFTDTETDKMFESLAGYLSGDDIEGTDIFSSIEIDVKDIVVEDKEAVVSAIITYELNGEEVTRESTINCIYYAEKWYISNFSID